MRRFTLLKSLFLAAVLAIGSSGAWAETVTLQLSSSTKFGTSSGSTLTQDGVEWTVNSSKGSINGSWQVSYEGEQFGTSKAPWEGNFTATVPGQIMKVEVVANTGEEATLSVTVGGTSFLCSGNATASVEKKTGSVGNTYAFEGTGSGMISVNVSNTKKAFYLNSIIVTYAQNVDPAILVNQEKLKIENVTAGTNASKGIVVTGSNLTEKIAVSVSGECFSVTPNELDVAGGELTVTYAPTVLGTHTGVLTLTSGEAEATVALSGSAILGVPVAIEASSVSHNSFAANWETVAGATEYDLDVYYKEGGNLITATEQIVDGETYLIAGEIDGVWYALSYQNKNNRPASEITIADNMITTAEIAVENTDETPYALVLKAAGDKWNIYDPINETYLGPGTGDNNYLKGSTESTPPTFTIEFNADNQAIITCVGAAANEDGRNIIRLNTTNKLFACYKSGQKPVYLYKTLKLNSVTDYPQDVTGTSHEVTGLQPETEYFYTVTAKAEGYTSAVSNEISVTTLAAAGPGTGIAQITLDGLYAVNGTIYFNAVAGERVEVINTLGQCVYAGTAVDGLNSVAVEAGIVVVKVGNSVGKVVVK